jgi:hypothetical protein
VATTIQALTTTEGFFATAEEAFAAATSSSGFRDVWCSIAGFSIRLEFAGEKAAAAVLPAFAHVLTEPRGVADLTVCIWDDVSSGTRMPPPPWQETDYDRRAEVRGFSDERFRTAFNQVSDTLSLCDLERGKAFFWVHDANRLLFFERSTPLLYILSWWMSAHGHQVTHSGAVGFADGGVLVVGKSGSGKSSTCLQCLRSPLLYAADDYCLVGGEIEPTVSSLYCSGKVAAENLGNFPWLRTCLSNESKIQAEDARFFLHPEFSDRITRGFPLRAILLPRITGVSSTTWRKVSSAKALLALAPSTIFQLPGAGGDSWRTLGAMARRVPAYLLELGTEREEIPKTIAQILRTLR